MSLLIHIGLYKTATTYLQWSVFRDPELGYTRVGDRGEMFEHIIFNQSIDWDAERSRAAFGERIAAAEAAGKVPVISDEHFMGPIGCSFYRYEYILERLRRMFPDSKVLMTVRDQEAILVSMYAEYVRAGGTLTFRRFIAQVPLRDGFDPEFDRTYLDYYSLLRTIHQYFAPEKVLVLSQNLLKENPEAFWEELKTFSGVQSDAVPCFDVFRPSQTLTYLALQRLLNFVTLDRKPNRRRIFLWRLFGFLNRRLPVRVFDQNIRRYQIREFRQSLRPYYVEANRNLREYLETTLGQKGRAMYQRLMFPDHLEAG